MKALTSGGRLWPDPTGLDRRRAQRRSQSSSVVRPPATAAAAPPELGNQMIQIIKDN